MPSEIDFVQVKKLDMLHLANLRRSEFSSAQVAGGLERFRVEYPECLYQLVYVQVRCQCRC